jgi:hypothetical protein
MLLYNADILNIIDQSEIIIKVGFNCAKCENLTMRGGMYYGRGHSAYDLNDTECAQRIFDERDS